MEKEFYCINDVRDFGANALFVFSNFPTKDYYFTNFPCVQLVNGFRIVPVPVLFEYRQLCPNVFCYAILPISSMYVFFFRDFLSACNFAKRYDNKHTRTYWTNRYSKFYSYFDVVNDFQLAERYE